MAVKMRESDQALFDAMSNAVALRDKRIAELEALINQPEVSSFLQGVQLEAAHQEERWGAEDREGKEPQDWFWLVGYLSGKALRAAIDGDTDKHLHHCISTAAVLANWHKHAMGQSKMRPGHSAEGSF